MKKTVQMKGKGIFLLYEGLPRTIIESQVIVHVQSMRKIGLNIEVWSYAVTKQSYNEAKVAIIQLNSRYNIPIRLFRGFRLALPFSAIFNCILLSKHLKKYNRQFNFIHCRTEYSATVAGFLKLFKNFRLVWDCRGDTESEFYLIRKRWGKVKKTLSFFKLYSIRFRKYMAARSADEAIFVSQALKKLYNNKHYYNSTIIPCVANAESFFFNSEFRISMRKKLNLAQSDIVFIYSGSLTDWQCFPITFSIIKKFISEDSSFKSIILTPDLEILNKYLKNFPSGKIISVSATLNEVNLYLNAADFGFLIREPGPINYVASPVKFAEYCLAGLPIIMTNAVQQSFKFGNLFGNVIRYNFGENLELPNQFSDCKRYAVSCRAKEMLSHNNILNKYIDIYQNKF